MGLPCQSYQLHSALSEIVSLVILHREIYYSIQYNRKKNRYAMRTCVCYLEIKRSLGKEGNARFANEGHLRFVSIAFGFHCGCWIARYVSELSGIS